MSRDLELNHRLANRAKVEQIAAELTEYAGHWNAGEFRFLGLIAQFDELLGWAADGCHSCAHWLDFRCGINIVAARDRVRVAHALRGLPKISEAMRLGQISYSKVRALTRVASHETEDTLLMIALHGTSNHVEVAVRGFRRAVDAEELSREARQQARRYLSYFHDDDGALVVKGVLPAETGALVIKALDSAIEEVPLEDESGRPQPRSVRRADAMGVVAERALANSAGLSGGERQQIVVHVDASTLRDSTAGLCELEGGPAIAAETTRRLACDCSVIPILEDARGQPLDVGRKTRTIHPALRRALIARDKCCVFPGCSFSNLRGLQAHHLRHWARGGASTLENLALMCPFHHRLVHEGGVSIEILDDGRVRFIRPDGRPFDGVPSLRGAAEHIATQSKAAGIVIDRNTAVTAWRGERMAEDLTIAALLSQRRRSQEGFGWHDLEG